MQARPILLAHSRTVLTAALIPILIAVGGACASTDQIAAFAAATTALAGETTATYEMLDRSSIDRKLFDAAASPSAPIDDSTFTGFTESAPDLQLRMQMVSELRGYSNALLDIATADFRKGIDAASQELYGSLVSLRTDYTKASGGRQLSLTDEDLAYFAAGVDAIGNAIAERKRQEAIRRAVIRFNPAVQEACALLAVEIPVAAPYVYSSLGAIESDAIEQFDEERKQLDFTQRLERLRAIETHNRAKRGVDAYFKSVSSGLTKVAAAHQLLASNATGGRLSSEEIVTAIGEVSQLARSVQEFHQQLPIASTE